MIAAVAEFGYSDTTVGKLVALAGVSKSTFYQHFESKQACFFATFETIVAEVTGRVGIAYRTQSSIEERLEAAFTRFAEIVDEDPAAASLVVVDALSLGAPAVPYIERSLAAFELIIRQSFRETPGAVEPSDLIVRSLVAGIRMVVYRCLRGECTEELADHLDPLLSWVLSYRAAPRPDPPIARQPGGRAGAELDRVDWAQPPDSAISRATLSQRDRILHATAQLAAKHSYAALTIPAISAAAGTSNQTFYEHFGSKEEAFIAAFDELCHRALMATLSASAPQDEWWTAIEAGFRALAEHIVAEPLFARIAFFEVPAAGHTALDHADTTIGRFTMFLQPELLPPKLDPLPPVTIEAIGGGVWEAFKHEIAVGNLRSLPEIAPQIAAFALTPLRAG